MISLVAVFSLLDGAFFGTFFIGASLFVVLLSALVAPRSKAEKEAPPPPPLLFLFPLSAITFVRKLNDWGRERSGGREKGVFLWSKRREDSREKKRAGTEEMGSLCLWQGRKRGKIALVFWGERCTKKNP